MMNVDHFIKSIGRDLKPHIDRDYRALVRDRYRMNVDNFWGVRMPIVHKVANTHYRQIKPLSIDDRFKVCDHLLKTLVYEHKIIAFRFGHLCRKEYERAHFRVLAGWLRTYVNDWSDGDELCTHVLGEYLVRYPDRGKDVLAWTKSRNRWMKRGAAVALILPVRKGQLRDMVFHVADRLLNDQDDLVQKGYGWMLKEASKRYPQDVFNYVLKHRDTMPRTALRYAIEKFPPARRQQAMQKKQLA